MKIRAGFNFRLIISVLFLTGCVSYLGGGRSSGDPVKMKAELDQAALDILDSAFELDSPIVDQHLHLVGASTPISTIIDHYCPDYRPDKQSEYSPTSQIWINPDRFQIFRHPILFFKTKVLLNTVKAKSRKSADIDSIGRLKDLVQGLTMPGLQGAPGYQIEIHLLAVDGIYEKGGTTFDPILTDMVVPNDYVIQLAGCLNSTFKEANPFTPVISINPHKKNALAELTKYKDETRYIKWVAPAMGFDPSDPDIDPFYQKVRDYGMVILSHTGGEHAFEVRNDDFRVYGDPLRMRRALDFGIPVILSHAGGDDDDPDDRYENNENFMRLMNDEKNADQWCLFGDTSALTIEKNFQHFDTWFGVGAVDLKYRMLYGSDYPLPATGYLFPLKKLVANEKRKKEQVYIDASQKDSFAAIFKYNPLAFDVAIRRELRHKRGQSGRLPVEMFMSLEENIRREMADRSHQNPRLRCHSWYREFVR